LPGCILILLLASFAVQKLFSFRWSPTFFFSFSSSVTFISSFKSRKSFQELPVYVFFYEVYGFRSYIRVFNPSWVKFCVWCKIMVRFKKIGGFKPIPTPWDDESIGAAVAHILSFPVWLIHSEWWELGIKTKDHCDAYRFQLSPTCSYSTYTICYNFPMAYKFLKICHEQYKINHSTTVSTFFKI